MRRPARYTALLSLALVLVVAVFRLADAQQYGNGGNTINGVTSVSGTSPIAVTTGTAPVVSITTPLPVDAGGTGVGYLQPGTNFVDPGNPGAGAPTPVLWLKADVGVTLGDAGALFNWADQSGANGDAGDCNQATNTSELIYVSNCQNGLPCLTGDGGGGNRACFGSKPTLTAPFAVFIAYKLNASGANTSNGTFFDAPPSGSVQFLQSASSTSLACFSNGSGATQASNVYSSNVILECVFASPTTSGLNMNITELGSLLPTRANAITVAVPDAGYSVGNKYGLAQELRGDVFEVVAYNGASALTEEFRQAVRNYLQVKWAIY